jgi:hypothetical protein
MSHGTRSELYAAENAALLRKITLNLLKANTSVKDSIRGKRLQAAFNEEILEQFLSLKVSQLCLALF